MKHPMFDQLLKQMAQLHSKKNADYAGDHDPLFNLKASEEFGIPAWQGTLVRISDKWRRIVELAKRDGRGEVKDEAIIDTLMDLSVYCLLCIILFKEAHGEKGV